MVRRQQRRSGLDVFTLPDVCLEVSNHQRTHFKMPIVRGGKAQRGGRSSRSEKENKKAKGAFDGIRVRRQTPGEKAERLYLSCFSETTELCFVHLVIC